MANGSLLTGLLIGGLAGTLLVAHAVGKRYCEVCADYSKKCEVRKTRK